MRTWVKLHTIILADPKMFGLSDHLFRVCINLFALAGFLDCDGELGTTGEIAFHLRVSESSMITDLDDLAAIGIAKDKKGVWELVNWQKFQSPKAPSAKPEAVLSRVRKSRERRKNTEKQDSGNDVTGSLHNSLQSERNENVTTSRKEKNRGEEIREENTHGAGAPEPDLVKALAVTFEQAAGIKLPTANTEKGRQQIGVLWWHPLREMVKMANGQAPALLQKAVKQMRQGKLTIAAPNSVLKVFTSLCGEAAGTSAKPDLKDPAVAARLNAELNPNKKGFTAAQ